MDTNKRKSHWENIFQTKDTTQVSWHQESPATSLQLIEALEIQKTASILEVGSGDSRLADCLLELGYSKLTLLDISEKALNTVKTRLSNKAEGVTFCTADITQLTPSKQYDIWHDRAVFHFLTEEKDINRYLVNVALGLKQDGFLIIGTFSNTGPNMCSGLPVQPYSEEQLCALFDTNFKKIKCFSENHSTPSGNLQNFLFCVFQRK